MSEEIKNECFKALTCLYIAVDESIADDVNKKVKLYIESQTREIKELQNSLNLAISKFQEIANSVADFTNKQK